MQTCLTTAPVLINTDFSRPEVHSNLKEKEGKLLISPFGSQFASDLPEWKRFVPDSLVNNLISQAHDSPTSGHFGVTKTLEKLCLQFF